MFPAAERGPTGIPRTLAPILAEQGHLFTHSRHRDLGFSEQEQQPSISPPTATKPAPTPTISHAIDPGRVDGDRSRTKKRDEHAEAAAECAREKPSAEAARVLVAPRGSTSRRNRNSANGSFAACGISRFVVSVRAPSTARASRLLVLSTRIDEALVSTAGATISVSAPNGLVGSAIVARGGGLANILKHHALHGEIVLGALCAFSDLPRATPLPA